MKTNTETLPLNNIDPWLRHYGAEEDQLTSLDIARFKRDDNLILCVMLHYAELKNLDKAKYSPADFVEEKLNIMREKLLAALPDLCAAIRNNEMEMH